ncbi:hypothetical protein GCM10023084_05210 [Streptomyces lacrimifluminis]|uniref:Uncharacterized protein n=1 Tax=Streptomyces lacrimifluminis TaxID=1500077 RepID=A0A917KP04_9ACTN|nr:hypothetical protein [Streptomyces lacrimifluminis]GGJ22689.1 hypothetical protein GCM10012282_18950 [Streptomyces lacrimifluminis]
MTITIPWDLTLTVRRGSVASPDKAAEIRDVRRTDGTATLVYDRHLANPGTAVWLARYSLRQHGYTVREVILDGMGPDITALFREASRLRLDVELGSGSGVPRVVTRDDSPASYLVPKGWDLADAADRLPDAHAAARPKVVRALRMIAEEKGKSGGIIDRALDVAVGMILETGDPDRVWDTLTRALGRALGRDESEWATA